MKFELETGSNPAKTGASDTMKSKPKPKPPHRVDEKLGFCDHLQYIIGLDSQFSESYGRDFDKMRIGKIENSKRYLGGGCWQSIEMR